MQSDKIVVSENRTNFKLPAVATIDVLIVMMFIGMMILQILERELLPFMVESFILLIGVKVNPYRID